MSSAGSFKKDMDKIAKRIKEKRIENDKQSKKKPKEGRKENL